jgi:CxxC motif-containing protein (DUF1111 family)
MTRRLWPLACAAIVVAALAARAPAGLAQGPAPRPGDPLPGLAPAEFSAFRLGLDDFLEVETSEEGLGPAFNGTSCAACHNQPAVGGIAPILEVRAAVRDGSGAVRGLDDAGETLVHLTSIPAHGCQPQIPADANVLARRAPIPLFGAGLVEAIGDEAILALADPGDADGDGVSGRAALVSDPATGAVRVGRFGWKAQQATLLAFGADAYRNEMGITNDLFPRELAVGVPDANMRLCDPLPEPEDLADPITRRRGIDNFASFMRLLAPVARGPITADAAAGEALFAAIGCATCHVPTLTTAPSSNPLFDRRPVPLFSDLLLHDVGTGDGIPQASALPDEIRTPALWGLRLRRPFLHDGRAVTIDQAIAAHGGEAAGARDRAAALTPVERQRLIAFLLSL